MRIDFINEVFSGNFRSANTPKNMEPARALRFEGAKFSFNRAKSMKHENCSERKGDEWNWRHVSLEIMFTHLESWFVYCGYSNDNIPDKLNESATWGIGELNFCLLLDITGKRFRMLQAQLHCSNFQLQVVLMMMIVVVIFAVCWAPQNIYFLLTSYYPSITQFEYIQEIYLGIYWLAMSNSMYNPIIYCWMNSR